MISEETFYGLAESRSTTIDLFLFIVSPRVQTVNPSSNFLKVSLPKATDLKLGGPWFFIMNRSDTFTLSIRDFLDNELFQLPPEEAVTLSLLSRTSQGGAWFFGIPTAFTTATGENT